MQHDNALLFVVHENKENSCPDPTLTESENTTKLFLSFQMAKVKLSAPQNIIGQLHSGNFSAFFCVCVHYPED